MEDRVKIPLLRMKGIWKYYELGETRIAALRGIDLDIDEGEFVAIWGPSGCGKSTLCNLMGMIDVQTSGSLEFMGRETVSLPDDEKSELRNNSIGFIFQSFNLVPVLSAIENVMLPLQIQGKSTRTARKKAQEGLSEVGLGDYAEHRPHKMSGGQQQRVAIARALINDPMLVIADEPTANLDSDNARKIIDLMGAVGTSRGTTFVFSTHDRRLLKRVRRLIHLQDGEVSDDYSSPSVQSISNP
jgi:putative ABC transport system ATP-binding protein